jgi:hypothetical protein
MDTELSTKTQYLATLYRLLLQLIVVILYVGKHLCAIMEAIMRCCKDCFTVAIASITRELETSAPIAESDDSSQ